MVDFLKKKQPGFCWSTSSAYKYKYIYIYVSPGLSQKRRLSRKFLGRSRKIHFDVLMLPLPEVESTCHRGEAPQYAKLYFSY